MNPLHPMFLFFSIFMLLLLTASHAQPDSLDCIATTRYTPHIPVNAATAGAGAAVADSWLNAFLNPALGIAWSSNNPDSRYTLAATWGKDSLWDKSQVGLYSLVNAHDFGRFLFSVRLNAGAGSTSFTQGSLGWSGRLFEKSMTHGAMDVGALVHISHAVWGDSADPLPYLKSSYPVRMNDTAMPIFKRYDKKETAITLDLGIFQKEVAEGVDFGLSCVNLLGYRFRNQNQRVFLSLLKPDSISPGVFSERDTVFYDTAEPLQNWYDGWQRQITASIAVRPPLFGKDVDVTIPADLSFLGLFDSRIKTRFIFRAGISATYKKQLCLRLGYSLAPTALREQEVFSTQSSINTSGFSGGIGWSTPFFGFDMYATPLAIGLGVRLER